MKFLFNNIPGNYFNLIGLVFNTAGSLFLLLPLLNTKKSIDDDLVTSADIKTGKYTQKKHIKDRRLGLCGFAFLSLGFILQIIQFINFK